MNGASRMAQQHLFAFQNPAFRDISKRSRPGHLFKEAEILYARFALNIMLVRAGVFADRMRGTEEVELIAVVCFYLRLSRTDL